MYFKIFTASANTSKDIQKAGFRINSYENNNVYNGTTLEYTDHYPKDYLFNNEIWQPINASDIDERLVCLAKTPLLPYQGLWNLFIGTNCSDDRIGALILMEKKHKYLLIRSYKHLLEKTILNKNEKGALKLLKMVI